MDAADNATDSAKLHVSTLLIASERALTNALEELGFAEDDDRVIQHEGRLAFLTCSHDPDCDDMFALISELPPDTEESDKELPVHDVDADSGRAALRKALNRVDPAGTFATIRSGPGGRATAVVLRRNPRRALAMASGADEASLRAAIREILPTVMFAVAMKPPGS